MYRIPPAGACGSLTPSCRETFTFCPAISTAFLSSIECCARRYSTDNLSASSHLRLTPYACSLRSALSSVATSSPSRLPFSANRISYPNEHVARNPFQTQSRLFFRLGMSPGQLHRGTNNRTSTNQGPISILPHISCFALNFVARHNAKQETAKHQRKSDC